MVQPRAQREIEERAMPLQVSGAQRYCPGTGLLNVHTAFLNPTRTGGGIPKELARTRSSSSLFLVLVLIHQADSVSGDENTKRPFPFGWSHLWPVGDARECPIAVDHHWTQRIILHRCRALTYIEFHSVIRGMRRWE